MKRTVLTLLVVYLFTLVNAQSPIVINHHCTDFYKIPSSWIDEARSKLHIAYGHSSHGSQLISGMIGIYSKYGTDFAFTDGGSGGTLDLHNYFVTGDLGYPDFTTWERLTRAYLATNTDVNVVIWSWCGQLSWAPEDSVNKYLNLMNKLEQDYSDVRFVYMTGHLDGTGTAGNLNMNNEHIRTYCISNNKILYDFADIESYDPDGLTDYLSLYATDSCYYDSNGDGSKDLSWAIQWSDAHPDSCFYLGECAHSHSLNCQQKGIAAWWLWARLAGWNGPVTVIPVTAITVTGAGGSSVITGNATLQLSATVLPVNATTNTVTWSIENVTGEATISNTGLVTPVANGTVIAKATAQDGSGISGTLNIVISDYSELSEPVQGHSEPFILDLTQSEIAIYTFADKDYGHVRLFDISGNIRWIDKLINHTCIIPIASLPPQVYIVILSGNEKSCVLKFVKP